MFRNFCKITLRGLLRNKTFSLLNIVGLAIGMASAVLICLWIKDELRFDRFYPKQDRLYGMLINHRADGTIGTSASTPEIMQPAVKREIPGVEDAVRLGWNSIGTLVILRQVRYAQGRKTGYNQQNLVYVNIEGEIRAHYEAIRSNLLASGAVTALSATMAPLTQTGSMGTSLSWPGMAPDAHISFMRSATEGGIVQAAGLTLAQGRDIDIHKYPTDSTACLINEAALKAMGLKDPIGQDIYDDPIHWHVVGVIKDFILNSPYEPIKPMIIKGPKYYLGVIHLKLNPNRPTSEDLAAVEKIFKTYNPSYPFEYHFIDEEYAQNFASEQRSGSLAALFAGLTVLISCLGLFGLATYMAESRIKEIGIRKVLGASATHIALLLSGSFVRLVLLSIAIATPISWYAMHQWLQGYTYRTTISGWLFVAAGGMAVLIAAVTVSFQALRAALSNPVKSLRTE